MLDQIVNISNPTLKDWLIICSVVGYALFRLITYVIKHMDDRRVQEEKDDDRRDQERLKTAEKYETLLTQELARSREEVARLSRELNEAVNEKLSLIAKLAANDQAGHEQRALISRLQNEEREIAKTLMTLRQHISHLEQELRRNNLPFAELSEKYRDV